MAKLHSDGIKDSPGPRWTFGRVAQGLLFALTMPLDAITEWAMQGVRARFPGVGPAEADPYVAQTLGIYPGRAESRASWSGRASGWLEQAHRCAGPWPLLEQLAGYFLPNPPPIYIVLDSGMWFARMPPGVGAPSGMTGVAPEFWLTQANRPPLTASNWVWDANTGTNGWSRFWVIIDCSSGLFTHPHHWGDVGLKWGMKDLTWGSNATSFDVSSMRSLVLRWKPAASRCPYIILDFLGHFKPLGGPTSYPNGTWNKWANRYQPAAYISVP